MALTFGQLEAAYIPLFDILMYNFTLEAHIDAQHARKRGYCVSLVSPLEDIPCTMCTKRDQG